MKTDALVQQLIDSYGNWFETNSENRAGGAGRMTQELYPYDRIFSPIQINKLMEVLSLLGMDLCVVRRGE